MGSRLPFYQFSASYDLPFSTEGQVRDRQTMAINALCLHPMGRGLYIISLALYYYILHHQVRGVVTCLKLASRSAMQLMHECWFVCVLLKALTEWTVATASERGRPTRVTRRSNSRKSFTSTATSPVDGASRWRTSCHSPSARSRSGSRTDAWSGRRTTAWRTWPRTSWRPAQRPQQWRHFRTTSRQASASSRRWHTSTTTPSESTQQQHRHHCRVIIARPTSMI